jgi:preprotein translocase subunit SecD
MGRRYVVMIVFLVAGLLIEGCTYPFAPVDDYVVVDSTGDGTVVIILEVAQGVAYTPENLQQAAQDIKQRLDEIEAEADVAVENDQIIVEMIGTLETKPFVREASAPGLLEFVDFSMITGNEIEEGACILTTEQVLRAEALLPDGEEPKAYSDYTCTSDDVENPIEEPARLNNGQPYRTIMTGSGLENAAAQVYGTIGNQYVVNFVLKDNGERVSDFIDYVGNNAERPMAIVLDGRLLCYPRISSDLSNSARAGTMDGGIISGNFTRDEASILAAQLKYGALALPLVIVSMSD